MNFSDLSIFKNYKILLALIIIVGVLLRVFLLFQNGSMFCDEIALINSVSAVSYPELFKGLKYTQVAPPLFLIILKSILSINTNNLYIKDFLIKLIPFFTSIISIPVFYKLIVDYSKNRIFIVTSILIFLFNPLTINYSVVCKQYSLELLISICLIYIFYNMIFKLKYRHAYSLLIVLSPWFSLSSFLLIIPYLFLLYFYNKKCFYKIVPWFLLSSLLFYFFYLKDVFACNYAPMEACWGQFGYFSLMKPFRFLSRVGQFYNFNNLFSKAFGLLIVFFTCNYIFSKTKIKKEKIFILLPIIFTLIVSSLHYYPMIPRLLLFLFPLLTIIIVNCNNKKLLTVFCIYTISVSFYYIKNPLPIMHINVPTSMREVSYFLKENLTNDYIIITDNDYGTISYYIPDIKVRKNITIPYYCTLDYDKCSDFLNNLPAGKYCFISTYKLKRTDIIDSTQVNKSLHKNSSAIMYTKS